MGIFNRSIPTYTVDTANKIRITKALPEEEPNTYIDDAFDPILNKAVRDRLIRQWGNPISATLAGYHEMLNNALVGSTKQWGPLGPGMGMLGSFGRTMDKGGDLILGTLTEGVKGVTGQGVESPFYNIFTKDEDYTGGKLLAAMGNSMAKLADAPELTEEDFGGVWKIPAIGIELATDPGILGGTLAKAGGAVGKRSSTEILQNLGKANNSVLADVGQLLSNYDDAMTKIALDVTAPGTRIAITKAWNKLDQLFQTSSAKNLQNIDLNPDAPIEAKVAAFDEYQHDPNAQTVVHMASNLEKAEEAAKLRKHYAKFANSLPLAEREEFIEAYKTLQDYFGVDEPLSHIDELRETYNRFEELFSEYKNYRDMFDAPDAYSEMLYERITPEHFYARDKLSDFKYHHYGHTHEAYVKIKNILDKTSKQRSEEMKALKGTKAMFLKDVPDSILELENIKYKTPAATTPTSKPEIKASDINLEFANVLRQMPGEDLRNFLKRNKISIKEYKARLEELNKYSEKLNFMKSKFDDAVQKQRKTLNDLISKKFRYMSAMPDYELIDEGTDELFEHFTNEIVDSKIKLSGYARSPVPFKINKALYYQQYPHVNVPIRSEHVMEDFLANNDYRNLSKESYDNLIKLMDTAKPPVEPIENITDDDMLIKRWLRAHGVHPDYLKLIKANKDIDPREQQVLNIFWEPSSKQRTKLRREYGISPEEYNSVLKKYFDRREFSKNFRNSTFKNPVSWLEGSVYSAKEISDFSKEAGVSTRSKYLKQPDAPFTISDSEHRLVNDPDVAGYGVSYAVNSLINSLLHYSYPKKIKADQVWDVINKNPIFRMAYIADYEYDIIVDDLKRMFKAKSGRDLHMQFDDPNIRQNIINFIMDNPELTEYTKGKYINVKGLKDAMFGKYDKRAKASTVQNQFVALDQLTHSLANSLGPVLNADRNSTYFISTIKDAISKYENGKFVIDPDKAFKPQTWYTKKVHDSIQFRLKMLSEHELNSMGLAELQTWKSMPKSYREAVNIIKNTGMQILGGSEAEAIYQWAKQMQDEVFLPAKHKILANPDITKDKYSGKVIVSDTAPAFDTKTLNNAIRSNVSNFKSIGDVKEFAKGLDLGFEIKFKNMLDLTLEGSNVKTAARALKTTYPNKKFVENVVREPALFAVKRFICDTHIVPYIDKFGKTQYATKYTLNEGMVKVLGLIVSAKDTDTIGKIIAKAPASVQKILVDRLSDLFTDIDLAPTFVRPQELKDFLKLSSVFHDTTAKITTDSVKQSDDVVKEVVESAPPSVNAEVVSAPPTEIDTVRQIEYEKNGVQDVFEDAQRIADETGGSPEDLPPEGRSELTVLYGKDKVDLFDLVNKAFESNNRAKYVKDVPLTEVDAGRKLANTAETLSKDKHSSYYLKTYDAISTATHGDIIKSSKMLDEIVTSGGYLGIRFDKSETAAVNALRASLQNYTNYVNETMGTSVLKVYEDTDSAGTYLRIALDTSNAKKILKLKFSNLKFADDADIIFEAPRPLTESETAFRDSTHYAQYDAFAKDLTQYTQGIYKPLGITYDNPIHIKHVKGDEAFSNKIVAALNKGVDSPELNELAKRLLNSDSFNHLYGTFGAVPFGRSLRGGNWRWDFKDSNTFDFEPSKVLNATFAEGTLSNTNVQNFVGLFMNPNYKVQTFFKTPDDIRRVLYATDGAGNLSGNVSNLDIIAPVFDNDGKIIKFHRYDKTTNTGLTAALKDENAIIVPSHLVASLDVWCKKNAKMSNRIYRFFNKMFGLPYKIGVLANPGFILGNVGDAYLKQATTMHMKYGTSMAEELVNVTDSIKDIVVLNNKATDVFDKYLEFCKNHEVKLPPSEQLLHSLNLNSKARRRFVDFLNGKMVVKGSEIPVTSVLSSNEIDSMRLWLYLNSAQPSTIAKNSVRDFSKDEIDTTTNNFIERIFYGKGKFDYKNPKTWGVVRNPGTEGTFYISEMWEAVARSAEVLNDLKHTGYDTNALTKILSSGADPEVAKKLHVDTVNAINTMFNSNFNYEAQSKLMDKIGYAVPFPTFFLKNFDYWMKLLIENPEYVDSAITIQEGLWANRDDEVEEDAFMAEAKGRGAVPINDGDEQGLSKFFRGIYKPTPLNSMFSAFNLLNHPIENLTNRVHPLINTPMQLVQGKLGEHEVGLATYSDAENVKYRPYSTNRFERNRNITDDNFNPVSFAAHKLNPYDRAIGNTLRFPNKLMAGDVQLSDVIPSVFQPDF